MSELPIPQTNIAEFDTCFTLTQHSNKTDNTTVTNHWQAQTKLNVELTVFQSDNELCLDSS